MKEHYRAKKLTGAIRRLEQRSPSKLRDLLIETCRDMLTVLEAVGDVEDAVGQKGTPCPVQSQNAIQRIRHSLRIPAAVTTPEKKPAASRKGDDTGTNDGLEKFTAGKPPYIASLVSIREPGCVLWAPDKRFRTESAACKAILREARARMPPVYENCISHWITKKHEHIMDFGSHCWYGVVESVANMTPPKAIK